MGDAEARALGAGSVILIEGKEYTIKPLTLQQLSELQREALQYYKSNYLRTYRENLDLASSEVDQALFERKLDEVARWDIQSLPPMRVFDFEEVPVTDLLKENILVYFPLDDGESLESRKDGFWKRTASGLLEKEQISLEDVAKWTGKKPRIRLVSYDTWWANSCMEGMISVAYQALRSNAGMTRRQVADMSSDVLGSISKKAEQLTSPDLGNT